MRTSKLKWMRFGLVGLAVVALIAIGSVSNKSRSATAQTTPNIGLVCTSDPNSGTNPTFALDATDGYILLGDANTMYMWSYAVGGQPFQYPGPVLCVNEGDTVTVVLHNKLNKPTSIMFPGQEDVQAEGAPAQPQFDGGGNLTSMTNVAAANGGSMTYSFVASKPGTYIYESGTNPEQQVRMGLAGVLVVRPAMGANFAYDRAETQFTPTEEFLVYLSEIDPYQHMAAESGMSFNLANYHPRYWLINGRGFPDSIADNFASWLPSQPYGALARIYPYDPNEFLSGGITPNPAYHPLPGMARYVNVGSEEFPHHPHANNGVVVGRDGNPLVGPGGEDISFEKFAINIGPGQTWDVIFKWEDAEHYNSVSNPVPVTQPDPANMTYGMFYSGSPYLGEMGGQGVNPPFPPGSSTLNVCGEYYIISHNHALYQLDAWGITMAGQITYLRVDPPLPNNCPQ